MHKERHHNGSHQFDIYKDIEKLKKVLIDASHDVTGKANQLVNESLDGLKEKSDHIKQELADYATERPFKIIGLAFVTGAVLGFLLSKRR